MSEVKHLTIDRDRAGQRIDNFLLTHLKGVPRSRIYRILRKGEVRINKKRVKPEYKLQANDCVRIPPVRVAPRENVVAHEHLTDLLEDRILFENKDLLILDKPSGLAVHGGSGISLGVIEIVRQMRPDCRAIELAHRLDRNTSGCLMIAKKRSMLRQLHELLRERRVDKRYDVLVKGHFKAGKRTVDLALEKNNLSSGERMVRVSENGKPSITIFKTKKYFKDATLVEAKTLTGRTHQIRVHAAAIGHPIAGDQKYGDDQFNQHIREQGIKRLMLHAASLQFTLPGKGDDRHIAVHAAFEHYADLL